jgi:hypothetical protein
MNLPIQIWRTQPGAFFCLATRRAGIWGQRFFTCHDLHYVESFIRQHENHDVYWCPHSLTHAVRQSDFYAAPSNMLRADLDNVKPRSVDPLPTVAWQTSPNRYAAIWTLDGEPTEDLRRSFNEAIGADAGGWGLAKVLRVPGTVNCKYKDTPRGCLLWANGPTHSLDAIARKYPPITCARGTNAHQASKDSVDVIIKKCGISGWLRNELLGPGQRGDERRHRMHHKLACILHEKGVPARDAFVLLKETAWNKHDKDNHGKEKYVWRLIDKIWCAR